MGLKSSQNRSSYLSKVNFSPNGFQTTINDNNRIDVSLRLGEGLRFRDGILELDAYIPTINFEGDSTLYPKKLTLRDRYYENYTYDNVLTLGNGTLYSNRIPHVITNKYMFKVTGTSLPDHAQFLADTGDETSATQMDSQLAEFTEYGTDLPDNSNVFLYYDFETDILLVETSNLYDEHERYFPICEVQTNNGSIDYISDRRARLTWYGTYSPSDLSSAQIGEIRTFPIGVNPGQNFLKCDGSNIPANFGELIGLIGPSVPNIPDSATHSYWIIGKIEKQMTITPESAWTSAQFNQQSATLGILEAYYDNGGTITLLTNSEINALADSSGYLPIANKSNSSITTPYRYKFIFPTNINDYSLELKNMISHNVKVNIDGNIVTVVCLDSYLGYDDAENQVNTGQFILNVGATKAYVALNKYDHYSSEIEITTDNTTELTINFLALDHDVAVYKNGQLLKSSEYTISNKKIVFSTALMSGDWVNIISRAILPDNKHAHLPDYDSGWVVSSTSNFTHNLNLKEPIYAQYDLWGKKNTGEVERIINLKITDAQSDEVTISSSDISNYDQIRLLIKSNQVSSKIQEFTPASSQTFDALQSNSITSSLINGNIIKTDYLEVNQGANIPFMNGFKNKFINGDFRIWQRGTSFSSIGGYTADRWTGRPDSKVGTTQTISRQTFTPGQTDVPGEPQYYLRWQIDSGATSKSYFVQSIENVRTFAGQKATFSFYAKANTNTTLYLYVTQYFGSSGSSAVTIHNNSTNPVEVNLTTSWQKFEYTIDVPSISGKTIDDSNCYIQVGLITDNPAPNITIDLARMQVEEGEYATDFEIRPFGLELMLCQRYYEKSYDLETPPGTGPYSLNAIFAYAISANYLYRGDFQFKVTKRAIPTVTIYSASSGAPGYLKESNTSTDKAVRVMYPGTNGFRIYADSSSFTADYLYIGSWSAEAEL